MTSAAMTSAFNDLLACDNFWECMVVKTTAILGVTAFVIAACVAAFGCIRIVKFLKRKK